MSASHGPLRVGIGGPVGTGKTALMDALCRAFRNRYEVAAITNDIYTKEDAEFLTPRRIVAAGTDHGDRDRRLPAHRDPRGCIDELGGRGATVPDVSGAGCDAD